MTEIYCISGLGADERVFKRLSVPGVKFIFLPWAPIDKKDDVKAYAAKMAKLIPAREPHILGLSFGGMLAVEISKIMPVKKLFLISTAKTKHELGEYPSLLQFFIRNELIPFGLFKHFPNKFFYDRFGAKTKDEKHLLAGVLKDTDPRFLKWAFKALLSWNNDSYPDNYVQLHGTADQIIFPRFVSPSVWVQDGTHIMVYSRADLINKIILEHLS